MSQSKPTTLADVETIHLTVPLGPFRSTTLTITPEAVTVGSTTVGTAETLDLRYTTRSENSTLWQQRLVRRVLIQGPDASIELALGLDAVGSADTQAQANAYFALVEHLHDTIEPRLRLEAMRQVQRGDSVAAGAVIVTRDGLLVPGESRRSRSLIAWERLPSAQFERGVVQIFADTSAGSALVGQVSMLAPRAVLLPELVDDAVAAFTQ